MPASPNPIAGGRSAAPGLVIVSSTPPSSCRTVTRADGTRECRTTLVSASWTIRYAARSTAAGRSCGRRPTTARSTVTPACRIRAHSSSTRARPGVAARVSSARQTTCRVERSSSSASALHRLIASSAGRERAGSRSRTCRVISACIWIAARPCPTTSCTSCASRSRSSRTPARSISARLRASASRAVRIAVPTANGTATLAEPGITATHPGSAAGWTSTCASSSGRTAAAAGSARRSGTCRATV